MSDSEEDIKDPTLAAKEPKMKRENGAGGTPVTNGEVDSAPAPSRSPPSRPQPELTHTPKSRSTSHSPIKKVKTESGTSTPLGRDGLEATIGGEVTLEMEPGKVPKLSRTRSQKVLARPPPLFLDEPSKTEEASKTFHVIRDCEYANKSLGLTEDEGLDDVQCDCDEDYDSTTQINHACGDDSDCINRFTKIECVDDCRCGPNCQNKRFQKKHYASVTVFKTEKKGYGLRADADLKPNDFIFEYIGEVIGESTFTRKMRQYDEQGIKHFYFMSLNKGEFIDATKRGNLGRFCNHSCNPNCYVDKWVVGDRLRMGIFAERKIKAGEELTFNYNVDRYGADPQPCYCGEPNCTGFIGGRTQTERATKLSNATIEALGIEDGDDWDVAVAKKAKRARKTGEADEEYVSEVKPKALEEAAVSNLMAELKQKKEKWIVVKLLERIQTATDEKVFTRVAKMHGYRILKSVLSTFMDDANICLQVLDVLFKFPRLTRNKIADSKIEDVVEKLRTHDNERVVKQATGILGIWSKLELGYRIPKRNPNDRNNSSAPILDDWRGRKRERTKSPSPPQGPTAPSGPRSNIPQRQQNFYRPPPRPFPRNNALPRQPDLPAGWRQTMDPRGKVYYFDTFGNTQWELPSGPAAEPPPPPPPKALTDQDNLQKIIDSLKERHTATPPQKQAETPPVVNKDKAWRELDSVKKQQKYDHKVIKPLVDEVQARYEGKMPAHEIKRLGKDLRHEITKKHREKGYLKKPPRAMEGSAKHKLVTAIREYFSKGHKKWIKAQEERKARKKAGKEDPSTTPPGIPDSPKFEAGSPELDVEAADENSASLIDESPSLATPADDPNASTIPPPPPPGSGPATPLDGDQVDAENPADEIAFPVVPPPPPPPEEEEADMMVNTEGGKDSLTDTKSSANADVRNLSSELKRKWDDGDSEDVEFKKLKEMDEEVFGKPNGIHKIEDVRMEDEAEQGTNKADVDSSVDGPKVMGAVANGHPGEVKDGN